MTVQNNPATGAAQSIATNHPTGASVVFAAALVIVAKRLGLDLNETEAAVLIAAVGFAVSAFSPRFRSLARAQLADNVPTRGETGPDASDAVGREGVVEPDYTTRSATDPDHLNAEPF